jgi:hypothetical protein
MIVERLSAAFILGQKSLTRNSAAGSAMKSRGGSPINGVCPSALPGSAR